MGLDVQVMSCQVRLLAEKMVELQIVPSVSPMTVCNTLKKMNLSLT